MIARGDGRMIRFINAVVRSVERTSVADFVEFVGSFEGWQRLLTRFESIGSGPAANPKSAMRYESGTESTGEVDDEG